MTSEDSGAISDKNCHSPRIKTLFYNETIAIPTSSHDPFPSTFFAYTMERLPKAWRRRKDSHGRDHRSPYHPCRPVEHSRVKSSGTGLRGSVSNRCAPETEAGLRSGTGAGGSPMAFTFGDTSRKITMFCTGAGGRGRSRKGWEEKCYNQCVTARP